jgi:hypothetical protein
MIDNLVRDLQVLWKAESLIGKIRLDVIVRRIGLFAFAGLIAAFGLGMANVAGFHAMQETFGPVWAAMIVAVSDLVLAIVVMLLGRSIGPGPEMEMVLDVRRTAIEAIETDTRDMRIALDSIGMDVQHVRETISDFVHHPLGVAAENLLVPAVLSILRTFRSR